MYSDSEGDSCVERFKLHSVAELWNLPEPEWLIEGVFTAGALVGLYGPSGHGKSFISLDWALSIATGTNWLGRSTRQGAAIYVAAEGGRSIRKRVQAWMKTHGLEQLPHAFFVLDSVQVRDEDDLALLAKRIDSLSIEPELMVLDTLARCFVGGEENSAKEVGEFVEGIAWLQQKTEAAVVVVHHTGKQANEIERGSSALRAAADVMVSVSMNDARVIIVKNNKQKDAEEFQSFQLQLQQVEVGGGSDETTSCVLVPVGRASRAEALPKHLHQSLKALSLCAGGTATTAEWKAHSSGDAKRTFYSHRKKLIATGYVESLEQKGCNALTDKGRLTVGGSAATATDLQPVVSIVPSLAAATATTPLGVAVAAKGAVAKGDRQ